jgi:hypothetical protein
MEILDYIEMQGHPLLDLNFTADILDSARDYLVRRGLSTTGRICAVSWGPVAVASTIRYPDLFQCVIVIGQTIDPRRVDELLVALTPESPDTAPDIPIMMFVGDTNDRIGSFDISRLQRGRGKGLDQARDVDPIRYDDLDMFIRYGPSRIDMLTRIDQFLGEHIGR